MRALFLALLFAAPSFIFAQTPTPDPLTVTLPSGRVVHFETAEQKAKFEAARLKQQQAQSTQPTSSPHPTATMGHTALDTPRNIPATETSTDEGDVFQLRQDQDKIRMVSVVDVVRNAYSFGGLIVKLTDYHLNYKQIDQRMYVLTLTSSDYSATLRATVSEVPDEMRFKANEGIIGYVWGVEHSGEVLFCALGNKFENSDLRTKPKIYWTPR